MIKKKILSLTKKPLPKSFGVPKKFNITEEAKDQMWSMGRATGITEDEIAFYITNYESGAPTPEWLREKIRKGKTTPAYKRWTDEVDGKVRRKKKSTLTKKPLLKKKLLLNKLVLVKRKVRCSVG